MQQNGSTVFNPLQNPGRNTVVKIYRATIIFNAQSFSAGRLTVTAIEVLSGPETLSLGVTSCAPRDLGLPTWSATAERAQAQQSGEGAGRGARRPRRARGIRHFRCQLDDFRLSFHYLKLDWLTVLCRV